jgi:L-histidine Nalpha-methyltransferase
VAHFNQDVSSVEMHLRSLRKQTVSIPAADLSVTFLEGETIWTESSHKYSLAEVSRIAGEAGFRCDAQWIDEEWPFAENLLIAV